MKKRYAKLTIETYLHWIKFYIHFTKKQHPASLPLHEDVEAFLSYLVNIATSLRQTQKPQALKCFDFLSKVRIFKTTHFTIKFCS